MMMMPELPGDLVEEILYRVPATSLKRLRSTCKRWNRLFDDKRFARKHFDKSPKQGFVVTLNKFRVRWMSINFPSAEITGELNLNDLLPNFYQCELEQVFHCDGLLLCTNQFNSKIMVWNPCNGQTRQVQTRGRYKPEERCAIGSYKDNKSCHYSYKILSYSCYYHNHKVEIYDMNSNSWRILDVTPDFDIAYNCAGVSLKGKTYWFARDKKEKNGVMFLLSFDYTAEIFERLHLSCLYPFVSYTNEALSVVREEKLSVLFQRQDTSKTEIWLTNKIDYETKTVSWSKVFVVDLNIWHGVSFVVDEENKVLVCCDRYSRNGDSMVYIVGQDNNVTQVDFGFRLTRLFLFNYAPSLIQIQQGVGGKRNRGE